MANGDALSQALQISGQGFDARLNSIVGAVQSLKQAQVEKQRFAKELEAEKDLIQFRSDVQVEQQKQIFEEIEKPQLEIEQQQAFMEQLQESFKDATDTSKQLADQFTGATFRNVSKYNLLDPQFTPEEITDESGNVQGYRPVVRVNGNEVPQPEFVEELRKRAEFGDFLSRWEQNPEDLGMSTGVKAIDYNGETFNVPVIGQDNISDIVERIKTDPAWREGYYEAWLRSGEGALVARQMPEEGEDGSSGRATPITNLIPELGRIKGQLQNGVKEYKFTEQIGLFRRGRDTAFNVDFDTTMGDVQNQINKALGSSFFDESFDLSKLPSESLQHIIAGNVDTLQENLEGDLQEWAVSLAEKTGSVKEQIDELVKVYNFYDFAYNEGLSAARGPGGEGTLPSPHEVILDIQNIPADLSTTDKLRQAFIPIDRAGDRFSRAGNKARLQMFSESFRQETQPALGIFNSQQRTNIE